MSEMLERLQHLNLQAGNWVCLDSPGGQSTAVYELAYFLREQKLNTCVANLKLGDGSTQPSLCASACIQLFLSGYERIASTRGLAIHRGHVGTSWSCRQCNVVIPWLGYAVDVIQSHLAYEHSYGDFRRSIYARAMDYGQDAIHKATDAHFVTDDEMRAWRLADPNSSALFVPDMPFKRVATPG